VEPIVFTNTETAKNYVALTDVDQRLEVNFRRAEATPCFNGFLSGITPAAAAKYVRLGGNLIREKTDAEKGIVETKNVNPLYTDFTKLS
jgi:hypothetical protein